MKKLMGILMIISLSLMLSTTAFAERQPRMRAALELLKKAEYQLEHASHDKGGHRVAALKHTREAIRHIRKGIRFDNRH